MKLDKPLNLTFTQPAQKISQAGSESEAQQLEELKKELQVKSQELSELKIKNRQLQADNEETKERQKLMDEELRKAEAQIELIMELMNDRNEESGE